MEVVSEVLNDSEAEERFTRELRRSLGLGITVELKPVGEFERTQFKARRIIDNRIP